MIKTISNTHRLTVVATTILTTIIVSLMLLLIVAPILARINTSDMQQIIQSRD